MPYGHPMTAGRVERDLVIVVCAVSAGIHAALTPEHFREGAGPGGGFLLATLLLAGLAVALTRRPDQSRFLLAAVATLAGLIGSYALAITAGLPLLHPEVEPVDGLALATKAIEAVGLLASLRVLRRGSNPALTHPLQPKGTFT